MTEIQQKLALLPREKRNEILRIGNQIISLYEESSLTAYEIGLAVARLAESFLAARKETDLKFHSKMN